MPLAATPAAAPHSTVHYIRFQSPTRSPRGHFPGIFALANGLGRSDRLTPEQWSFWRMNNDWYDTAYLDPAKVDPTVYDHGINPGATAWFKSTAVELLARVPGYLDLLAAHDVACVRLTSSVAPGRIVYEDENQIVVIPAA